MSQPKKIETVEQLKSHCNNESATDFFINFGVARSSKAIIYYPEDNTFWILNEIDDTEETLTEKELLSTNIYEAIIKGQFYKY